MISINDKPLQHEYDVFLDGYSLINKKRIDEEYIYAQAVVKNGFKTFFINNWIKVLKDNLWEFVVGICSIAIVFGYTFREFVIKFFLIPIIVVLFLPLFVFVEWRHNKTIVKKYKKCFRPLDQSDQSGDGSMID